ncbi:conserved hypothetical protein [Caldicellulosiruptor hydrothermalis 108]|uniref:Signal transduction protein with Nacht domain n=1 Tax=Caldicellulosiruptor hydrothermalis (strain DSM 18901 / VKM B-2411 / 108) TaxID=632292 RepID=E4Q8M1_CALH1|nr:hypothetical protein [Caldicellulosiruptor hydrothermalis]ADQ06866.1 conserved hypothetical protein [Caldicellulosiruptor hydrothermalis 108]
MRKQLYDGLVSISDDKFHRLCDEILEHYNPEYSNLDSHGMHLYKDKPVPGTPDSIKFFPDGSIYAFQYTTSDEKSLKNKLLRDIKEVGYWEYAKDVRRVVLCCNSKVKDDIRRECRAECSKYGWDLDIVDIDLIISLILNNYDARVKASKYFEVDVFSINLESELKYYIENKYPLLASREIRENYHRKLLEFDIYALELKAVSVSNGTEIDFKTKQNIILTGEAGAGKSTFVKRWFLECLKEKNLKSIPVFCELRSYCGEALPEYIKINIEKGFNQINIELINRLLLEGRFQIFLDGFDELSEKYFEEFKIKCLQNLKYNKNTFVITCRNNQVSKIENVNFEKYIMKPLEYNAILNFVSRVVPEKLNIIKDFCNNNTNILKLLSNPFNLTIVVSIIKTLKQEKSIIVFLEEISSKPHYFYKELFNQMLKWNRDIINKFKLKEKFLAYLVSYIAFKTLNDMEVRLNLCYINRLIADALNEFSLFGQINIDDVRDCLVSCKFIQELNDYYQFEHNNLVDFFASVYILEKKDDSDFLADVFKNPVLMEPLLIAFENENSFFEKNIENIPSSLFQKAVERIDDFVSERVVDFVRKVFSNDEENNENFDKALCICSRFYYDERLLMAVFEYLKRKEEKGYKDFSSFRFKNSDINAIFNSMPGIEVFRRMRLAEVLDLLTNPFKYGKAATILAARFIKHLDKASDEQWDKVKDFYLRCFKYKDKDFLYYILIELDSYFRIKPKGVEEVYEMFKKTYKGHFWGLANNLIIEVMELMGELKPCDNDEFIRELVERALNCEKNNDYYIGQQLATLNFEEIEYLWSAPAKVRKIIGDEAYKKALQFAFNDPKLNENEIILSDMLFYISEFNDDNTLKILRRYCYYTSEHYFYNGKWDGVRTYALEGLYRKPNAQKLNILLSEFKNSKEYTYKIFFLYGIYKMFISNESEKLPMIAAEYKKAKECLLDELENPNNLREAIIQVSDFYVPFRSSYYLTYFIQEILSSLFQEYVFEICFEILNSENKKDFWDYVLTIIDYVGNEDWLKNLNCFGLKNPDYADKVANIIRQWRTKNSCK